MRYHLALGVKSACTHAWIFAFFIDTRRIGGAVGVDCAFGATVGGSADVAGQT